MGKRAKPEEIIAKLRDLLMRQRTMLLNAARGHLAEFGIIAPQGAHKAIQLINEIRDGEHKNLPDIARTALIRVGLQLDTMTQQIRVLERELHAWHRQSEVSRRLETIPGIGIITATALTAGVTDPSVFKSGRQFAAFIGLTPRQNSSGGKERLGRISKKGDRGLGKIAGRT